MESSSENSFTWTDTSSDSIDSMVADDTQNEKSKMKVSDSIYNGTSEEYDLKPKIKVEEEQTQSGIKSNKDKKRMVKLEPESDCDIPKKKKKNKHIKNDIDINDSMSYDETYLDLRVKQECNGDSTSVNQIKKKRRHSSTELSESITLDRHNHSDTNEDTLKSKKSKKKKKKSKKRSDSESHDAMETDHKLERKETNITALNHNKVGNKSSVSIITESSFTENNTFQDESGCGEISAIQGDDDHSLHTISLVDNKMLEKGNKNTNDSLFKSTIINQLKIGKYSAPEDFHKISLSSTKRASRISDRIRFEDEEDLEIEDSNIIENRSNNISSKLGKFIKASSHMKLLQQQLHHSSLLTDEDDIWIVKCPKEIDIEAFLDADLNINGKCKIKISGQTYDGSLDEEQCDTMAALSMNHSKYKIDNLPLSGIISFRKRIPKAHFRDDNIIVNNQTNFIPLPETKCRHPLFGLNYKKALKIPTAVAQRLNPQNNEQQEIIIERRKKKKHKIDKSTHELVDETDANHIDKMSEHDLSAEAPQKKKKKRKTVDDEGPPPKRFKKIKHDPESAEAWESEKAIEQNLFTF